jgi:hypothetical protein
MSKEIQQWQNHYTEARKIFRAKFSQLPDEKIVEIINGIKLKYVIPSLISVMENIVRDHLFETAEELGLEGFHEVNDIIAPIVRARLKNMNVINDLKNRIKYDRPYLYRLRQLGDFNELHLQSDVKYYQPYKQ